MDDTQQSRVSDATAAATRKRRSSILKSQRPARTPFSELEFNVATPTDTAKSRRVSFSRRTGVAEFVTNEGTTTWKNFYEEHNKSLESSSNDSEANASRQPVGHLGKRIFDQQFEEVEAVDFISGLANGSLNNVNFSQQLASLELTADGKLTAPQNKFELSAFTEQSKLFGNDFTAPSIGDNSGRIDVNFSAIQQIEKDDLDEIEKDLERGSGNIGCHGPFSNRQNMSEYIEIDLNMTHVVKNDEDMSITDTVHSPVQNVSKTASKDKKASLNNDWAADKENIAINPYAAPCEDNFAINEEPDQVLVFDGKRLTLQPDIPEKDKNYRQTLLPNSSAETPQRKTIVLNVNDDLPNFIQDNNMLNSKYENSGFSGFQEIKADEDEISDTMPVHKEDIKSKSKIHDHSGNISMTQALPTNIICHAAVINQDANSTKRRTIVFNESTSNVSMTEAIPVKLLTSSAILPDRRRTIVYEDDTGDISITQAVPSNILGNQNTDTARKQKTIVFDSDEDNISMTQALTSNILDEKASKRKTIVFDDDSCNVSFTQALPANIMLPDKQAQEKRRTIKYENDTGDISVTQALPSNVILPKIETEPERRRTVLYEDDTGNVSVTQALPSNIILEKYQLDDIKKKNEAEDILTTQSLRADNLPNVFANDTGDISITQAVPAQLLLGYSDEKSIDDINTTRQPETRNKKRTTIVYNNDEGDISMTEAISANIIEKATNEQKTIVYDEDEAISMTLAVSANDYLLYKLDSAESIKKPEDFEEIKTKVTNYDVFEQVRPTEDALQDNLKCIKKPEDIKEIKTKVTNYDMFEQVRPTEDALQDNLKCTVFDENNSISQMSMTSETSMVQSLLDEAKRRTVIFDNDNCDISMTKPIPAGFMTAETEVLNKTEPKLDVTAQNQVSHPQLKVIVMQTTNNSQPMNLNVEKADDSKVELPIKYEEVPDKLMTSTDSKDQIVDKEIETDDDATDDETGDEESLVISPEPEPSYVIETEDKSLMAVIESNTSSAGKMMDAVGNTSVGSMFYVTKECEAVIQTDSQTNQNTKDKENELEEFDHLERKLAELQTEVPQQTDVENDNVSRPSLNANDTQNLLQLISHLTDNGSDEDDVKPVAVKVEDQGGTTEHTRLSVAPNRQSIALSREDLLSNISMAQAALQKSRLALDDSESADDTREASIDMSKSSESRTSFEVVKTLNFDDESTSETSKDEEKISPLKKTVFAETSYTYETKGKVIPTYLKDVSDGIKELMLDLVKPVSDDVPFQNYSHDRGLLENLSTHSTEVQANLTTPSQIDLDDKFISVAGVDSDNSLSTSINTAHSEKSSSRAYRNQVKFACVEETNRIAPKEPEKWHEHCHSNALVKQPPQTEVLIFDHLNPLNNVLLAPINLTDVHTYQPRKTDEILNESRSRFKRMSYGNNYEVETAITPQLTFRQSTGQQNIDVYQKGDQSGQNDVQLKLKSTCERTTENQSVDATLKQSKDGEVNTLIAMRGNKELLQANSSLTLVDELTNREYSNARIKYFESLNMSDRNTTKGKKRFYSPSKTNKHNTPSNDTTPKPIKKMQKISRSPMQLKVPLKTSPKNDSPLKTQSSKKVHQPMNRSPQSPKSILKKSEQAITVQRVKIDYQNLETESKHMNSSEIKININRKSESRFAEASDSEFATESDASFTSSMKNNNSTSTGYHSHDQEPVQATPWLTDCHSGLGTASSKLSETDSGVNIVAKIDMLPFMGGHECEWDSRSVPDTWSFRLQHGRLKLTIKLAHRDHNDTGTRVRGDTPVLNIAAETVRYDPKNPVATLCVRFACETIRYIVTRSMYSECYARDIPHLLRRCAAVTRIALRWGWAMHNSKLQLAYAMDGDGNITLKVANIRLRSVWEVSMRIELTVDDNRGVPWPKAKGVCVTPVVSELLVPEDEVRRVLNNIPCDWGHVPRTIWRIFRYLKHKTRNDNFMI